MELKRSEKRRQKSYWEDPLIMPPECDALCRFRTCYQKSENKGVFQPGRGYTSYHTDFHPVCNHRHLHGCPDSREKSTEGIDILRALKFIHENGFSTSLEALKPKERRRRRTIAAEVLVKLIPLMESCVVEQEVTLDETE